MPVESEVWGNKNDVWAENKRVKKKIIKITEYKKKNVPIKKKSLEAKEERKQN